jgi:SAM-dependent methyltransferase
VSLKAAMKRLFFPGFNLGVRSRRRIERFFLQEPDATTLDIGCGNGFFTALAARRGGTAVGISFDGSQVQRCREFLPRMKVPAGRVTFDVARAEDLGGDGREFDQVLCLEVLEHVDDDQDALRRIARVLRPAGILHVTTPDVVLGPWVGALDRRADGGHCRLGYSAQRLEHLVRSAGLDVAYITRVGTLGDYLAPVQNTISRALGGSEIAQGVGFLCVFPIYWLLKWMPAPTQTRIFHYVIARKPIAAATHACRA